ncbi:DNA polymerase III epsilon subunit domain-containing protein [Rhizobium etli bv. mimosae str. IE4771]|uniref:DNA polymerase III epsilon subunit domain-containing protein n=1 Tax=Rhizobium etli bv. mimosae str. IE4771 TaxID=1432050 RepID=A0A060I3I2_RHIET|nr:BRCT domain-containing protein [Rhizobium sp. IE4771]AIC28279.1 DNA polymerase III epsilon subunit domain-containing protein [Rhizobium sp. IE4771]
MEDAFYNKLGNDRITSLQVDELLGLARGLVADGNINQAEVEFLEKWLVANAGISDLPILSTLFYRVRDILSDGVVDEEEKAELLDTLNRFSNRDFELGETLKATTLPLCAPAPVLSFEGRTYCFTGTFNYGQRKHCEAAVTERGASAGSLTQKTNVLVIGMYATDSWKHSSFGNKIMNAVEYRLKGLPISIVSEEHWVRHL